MAQLGNSNDAGTLTGHSMPLVPPSPINVPRRESGNENSPVEAVENQLDQVESLIAAAVEEPQIELSIVMPCLNEADTLAICIKKCNRIIEEHDLSAEVIIADNGSVDGSIEIAKEHGARVVHVKAKGYGNALRGGIDAARGKYVIMGDADDRSAVHRYGIRD